LAFKDCPYIEFSDIVINKGKDTKFSISVTKIWRRSQTAAM